MHNFVCFAYLYFYLFCVFLFYIDTNFKKEINFITSITVQ